jgi:hypothetical protein
MEKPKAPLDPKQFVTSKAALREKLIRSVSLKNDDDRLAALVYLLEARKLVRDEDELQDVLGISRKQILAARSHGAQALAAQDELGKYLKVQVAAPAEATLGVQKQPEPEETNGPIEKRLVESARKHFGVDDTNVGGNELKRRGRYVNWAVLLIAQASLGKKPYEAAVVASVQPASIANMRRDGREEYATKGYFYETVQKICKEIGIPSP